MLEQLRIVLLGLSCCIAEVASRHQYHNQFNQLWETELSKEHVVTSDQFARESKFDKLEHELELLSEQPYFGRVNNRSRANLGEVAYLPCRVKFMQEGYMVTWLRTSDSVVLSVGSDTFSSDSRLSVVHINRPQINADDWTLIINRTKRVDRGRYECSVNTLPKISHTVDLVVEDEMAMQDSPAITAVSWDDLQQAKIQGPKTQYVSEGSTVALQCSIPHVSVAPSSLYWTKDGKVFTAKDRPGISLESERLVTVSTSKLFISHVSVKDSANYSCVSDISKPDSVQLVVSQALPGYALMFYNNASNHIKSQCLSLEFFIVSLLCLRQHFQ